MKGLLGIFLKHDSICRKLTVIVRENSYLCEEYFV